MSWHTIIGWISAGVLCGLMVLLYFTLDSFYKMMDDEMSENDDKDKKKKDEEV